MSLIGHDIHEWADEVTRGLQTGVPLDTAQVVGLAQEIVRLHTAHRGAVEAMREIAEELDLLSGGRVEGRYLAGVAARLRAAAGGTAEQSGTRSAHVSRESRA